MRTTSLDMAAPFPLAARSLPVAGYDFTCRPMSKPSLSRGLASRGIARVGETGRNGTASSLIYAALSRPVAQSGAAVRFRVPYSRTGWVSGS